MRIGQLAQLVGEAGSNPTCLCGHNVQQYQMVVELLAGPGGVVCDPDVVDLCPDSLAE